MLMLALRVKPLTSAPPVASDRMTSTVSATSHLSSSTRGTSIVAEVSPGANVSVPSESVKSRPAVARRSSVGVRTPVVETA